VSGASFGKTRVSDCTTWIVTRKKLWYLVDVWRQRVDHPALKASV
jgi:hypothetical protein